MPTSSLTGRRILVVDDSAFTCEAVAWALRQEGFVVQVARDLWDLDSPTLEVPDLVLMDVVLQEAFGDDLATLLRATRGFTCPILLLSSLPEQLLEHRAADAELDGYISKRSGLGGIVARVHELLGSEPRDDAPAADSSERFEVTARQRIRRMLYTAATEQHWNASAIAGEAQALAGDADLAAAPPVAEAARALRDVARRFGGEGSTPELRGALDALASTVPASRQREGILLVVTASEDYRDELMPALDAAGFVMVEAQSLVELRPKLHAADFDLVIVDEAASRVEPTLLHEIRKATSARIAHLRASATDDPDALFYGLGAERLVEKIRTMLKPDRQR